MENSSVDNILGGIEEAFPLPPNPEQPLPQSVTTVEDLTIPPTTTPAEAAPEAVPPPIAEPPAPQPPQPVAVPPTPEPTPPVLPAGTEPAAEPQGGPSGTWKAVREAKQREAEALAELQAARERERQIAAREEEYRRELERLRTPQPPAETEYQDPLEQRLNALEMEARTARMEAMRLQQVVQHQQAQTQLASEDSSYVPEGGTHQDYAAARDWYIQQEMQNAEVMGEVDMVAARIRAMTTQNPAGAQELRDLAMRNGTTEAEIARQAAKEAIFQQRVQLFQATAAQRGVPVPALVWEAAKVRGFTGAPRPANGNGNGAAPAAPAPPAAASAVEALRREQTGAAEASLASMPTTASSPSGILTQTGFLAMDRGQQGRIIDYMDSAAQRGMVPEDWMEQMGRGVTIPIPGKLA